MKTRGVTEAGRRATWPRDYGRVYLTIDSNGCLVPAEPGGAGVFGVLRISADETTEECIDRMKREFLSD